jgi:DNA-binding LacI/PurR family transcriptional regulator
VAERPTALFCWNDTAASYALPAIRDRGLRVPQDVSLIGFDDIPTAGVSYPPLTTVRQPYHTISRVAVEVLLSQIRGDVDTPQHRFLAAELVERGSVAAPSA